MLDVTFKEEAAVRRSHLSLAVAAVAVLGSMCAAQGPCAVPQIVEQPVDQIAPVGRSILLMIEVTGGSSYQWRRNGVALANSSKYTGVRTDAMLIRNSAFSDAATYDVVVSNACGAVASRPVAIGVRCPADLDDGSMTGSPDGGVEIADFIYYLIAYDEGWTAADLDDGSATGQPDGGVSLEDLLYFLEKYSVGC